MSEAVTRASVNFKKKQGGFFPTSAETLIENLGRTMFIDKMTVRVEEEEEEARKQVQAPPVVF